MRTIFIETNLTKTILTSVILQRGSRQWSAPSAVTLAWPASARRQDQRREKETETGKRLDGYQKHIQQSLDFAFLDLEHFLYLEQAFFLTPAAEKTKTQRQNSSKKLKEKTQPLGGRSLPYAKLKKKLKLMKFSPQNSKLSKGQHFSYHFY